MPSRSIILKSPRVWYSKKMFIFKFYQQNIMKSIKNGKVYEKYYNITFKFYRISWEVQQFSKY